LVLDEPDVYLHADLQRKLIRTLRERPAPFIVATHSVEMMTETPSSDLLILDRETNLTTAKTHTPFVNKAERVVGSVQNMQLFQLSRANCCLAVEGADLDILSPLWNTLFPGDRDGMRAIPAIETQGFSGWQKAVGIHKLLEDSLRSGVAVYCLLDRDFHRPAEISRVAGHFEPENLNLWVWSAKEIENYLVVPTAISRCIGEKLSSEAIDELISAIVYDMRLRTRDRIAEKLSLENRRATFGKLRREADALIDESWGTKTERRYLVGGKEVLKQLNGILNEQEGESFSVQQLAAELRVEEISDEVKEVLSAIQDRRELHCPT
jgi:hypothetical protein